MSKEREIHGYIGYFNLQEWWNKSFSKEEQEFIKKTYRPMEIKGTLIDEGQEKVLDSLTEMGIKITFTDEGQEEALDSLTEKEFTFCSAHVTQFLSELAGWFIKKEHANIANRILQKMNEEAEKHPREDPGCYRGRHYTTYIEEVKNLKRNGQLERAEALLIELVAATEAESRVNRYRPAPWYYDELAKIYRKQKEYVKELSVCARYTQRLKELRDTDYNELLKRMEKAKQLLAKQKQK